MLMLIECEHQIENESAEESEESDEAEEEPIKERKKMFRTTTNVCKKKCVFFIPIV